jgi:hypothetical protein
LQSYWKNAAQTATVSALVQHQGSLKYSDPTTLAFEFLVPLTLPPPATPPAPPTPPPSKPSGKAASVKS